jgi:hypothetical protein
MIRGVELVDRYGPEIEYDFLTVYHGLHLSDWFSGRGAPPWSKLVRLADALPSHSRFKAAIIDDDELAARLNLTDDEDGDKSERRKMTYEGYDPVIAKLTDACDLLIGLQRTLIQVNSEKGKGPKDTKFMDRPESAVDRARRRMRQEKIAGLRQLLVPSEN